MSNKIDFIDEAWKKAGMPVPYDTWKSGYLAGERDERDACASISTSCGKTWGESNETYLNEKSSVDPADAITMAIRARKN